MYINAVLIFLSLDFFGNVVSCALHQNCIAFEAYETADALFFAASFHLSSYFDTGSRIWQNNAKSKTCTFTGRLPYENGAISFIHLEDWAI